MGIDALFYVETERDLTPVFNDLWWKIRSKDEKIYVHKIDGGYEYYNLDRYYGPGYRRGYMPRLFTMFQVVNQNLIPGEHIYYVSDTIESHSFFRDVNKPDPTTLEEMQDLLLDWCSFMGLSHLAPSVHWSDPNPPQGYDNWDRTPKVVMD